MVPRFNIDRTTILKKGHLTLIAFVVAGALIIALR